MREALTILAVTVRFLVLHTVDGREIQLNPQQVTTMREAHEAADPRKPFTADVQCQINTVDGKFVTVTERCDAVRAQIKEGMP